MSDVEAGGATVFTNIGQAVYPSKVNLRIVRAPMDRNVLLREISTVQFIVYYSKHLKPLLQKKCINMFQFYDLVRAFNQSALKNKKY